MRQTRLRDLPMIDDRTLVEPCGVLVVSNDAGGIVVYKALVRRYDANEAGCDVRPLTDSLEEGLSCALQPSPLLP